MVQEAVSMLALGRRFLNVLDWCPGLLEPIKGINVTRPWESVLMPPLARA